jgi:GxxExxY protein
MADVTTDLIMTLARKIMEDLGAGYSECIYQNALRNKLLELDPECVKEKTIPVFYEGQLLGTCRADLVTSSHIIEVKAVKTMPSSVGHQIGKYLTNLKAEDGVAREGLVINFNQDSERCDFMRAEDFASCWKKRRNCE